MLQIRLSLNVSKPLNLTSHHLTLPPGQPLWRTGELRFLAWRKCRERDTMRTACKIQSMLSVEKIRSLYEEIQADADCLVNYEVMDNCFGRLVASVVDGDASQGQSSTLSGSVVPSNDPNSSARPFSDACNQPFPNAFDKYLADDLNTNSLNNSNVTSQESAIRQYDHHQSTPTWPGPSKDLGTRSTNDETETRSLGLTTSTARGLERSTQVTSEEIESTGVTPEPPRKKQSLSSLQPTVEDAPDEDETAAVNATSIDDSLMDLTGVGLTDSSLQIPQTEQYSSESQRTADDAPSDNEDSDSDDYSSSNDNFGDSDIDSAVDGAIRFLQEPSSRTKSHSSKPEHLVDSGLNSEGRVSAPISPPLDNSGLPALPNKLADESQLPLSPESCQASSKRKLSLAVESQSDQSSRNLRPRLAITESSCQSDDTRENAYKSSLSPKSNTCHTKGSHANSGVPHSGRSPRKPIQDRWNGLFSCHSVLSTLSSAAKDEIERKCNQVLRPDFAEFMEKHIQTWISTGFWHSPSLQAVQAQNNHSNARGHAIWRYVEAMSAEEETYYLKSRLAHIKLYLDYVEELDRQREARHPDQTAKIKAIDIICGSGSLPKATATKTRKRFHEHKLIGERWWWSGCFLGHGFFILCSEETGKKVQNKSFSIDAFVLYILSNRTDLLSCISKFNHMVDSLLTGGKVSGNLSKKEIQQWIREAKASGPSTIRWERWSTNAVASKASEFLLTRSNGSSDSLPH
ncbi:hypothetical protein N7523_002108 [Penicillium sp. IBT 18751x]|nr:hypothetical protein N7523_008347 [Penicillium sp. IBT 18751x]KAJ6126496.1 hypothetical protein N7523_002108 [Penicillium sp. IBT 18751x]